MDQRGRSGVGCRGSGVAGWVWAAGVPGGGQGECCGLRDWRWWLSFLVAGRMDDCGRREGFGLHLSGWHGSNRRVMRAKQ